MNCPSCSSNNPLSANFCNQCGARLAPRKARVITNEFEVVSMDAERRQLTVMFCDLVDSTVLASRLDPEDMRDIIRAYQSAVEHVIGKLGGHIAQYQGDGLLIYFGYPVADENDAERAVRAGLDIIHAVGTRNEWLQREYAVRLAVRIGVHTGPTVVGATGHDRDERIAIGETPNIAARLQGLATPDTIVVSADTLRLVRGHFRWDELGPQSLRGVAHPVEAFRILEVTNSLHGVIDSSSRRAPMFGREHQLAVLTSAWERARIGQGSAIVVSGEAGVGKSRLVRGFRDAVDGASHTWVECRSSPFYNNSAFHPLLELAPQLWGLSREGLEQDLTRLEAALDRLLLPREPSIQLLGGLFGVPLPEARYAPLSLSPLVKRQRILETLAEVILRSARVRPLILHIEDLQWMDQSSLEFLGRLRERVAEAPMLMVLTARPSFEQQWPVDATIALTLLDDDDVAALVASVAGDASMAPEMVGEIVRKAQGNPLFVEELTAAALDAEALGSSSSPNLSIPSTLQGSLMARLDLIVSAKSVAQVAAVIGREVPGELLADILDLDMETLSPSLQSLVEAHILQDAQEPQGPGRIASMAAGAQDGIGVYQFKHALLQDAAYNSLTRRSRRHYHERVATALQRRAPETPPEILGHHFAEAGRVVDAVNKWHLAGQMALGNWALHESINHHRAGLEILAKQPDSPERNVLELSLRVTLGVPIQLTQGFASDAAADNYGRLFELCELVGEDAAEQRFWAYWGLWTLNEVRAVFDRAQEMAARMLEIARRMNNTGMLVGAHVTTGAAYMMRGHLAPAREHFETAIGLYDMAQHAPLAMLYGLDVGAMATAFLTWVLAHQGEYDLGRARAEEALSMAAAVPAPPTLGFVYGVVAAFYNLTGDYSRGVVYAEKLTALAETEGMPHWVAQGQATAGWGLQARGDLREGAALIRRGLVAYLGTGTRAARSYFNGALIEAELALGRCDEARVLLAETLAFVEESQERYYLPELYRLEGRIALADGAPDSDTRARACFERALDVAKHQGARAFVASAERSLRAM